MGIEPGAVNPRVSRVPAAAVPIAGLLFLGLAVAVGSGAVSGRGLAEVLRGMWQDPWGRATLIDLYVGFFLFALWIFHRERSKVRAVAWVVATCFLGNLIPCVYVITAALGAKKDGSRFWHGS